METATGNPLLSSQKSSDSGLHAVLHPLVLLTISDYITRHTLRGQDGPVVGALLGQQNGREVTMEHAFECATVAEDGEVRLDVIWFKQRLAQMKTIHSSPQLDLVGWYTLLPRSGPTPGIRPIHAWMLSQENESSLLLGFHPEESVKHDAGSRLPLTVYETSYEAEEPRNEQGEDKEMRDAEPPIKLKFRELPYSVDTSEAEMISIDFVARGAGNATAVEPREQKKAAPGTIEDLKGKRKMEVAELVVPNSAAADADEHVLSREDEEMIAALTVKANSVKMLQSRIDLLTTYLERLPPSHLTDHDDTMSAGNDESTVPSYTILRSIQALVNRLSLVVPSATEAFEQEILKEANDVYLMELLNNALQGAVEIKGLGRKYNIVETSKTQNKKHADEAKIPGSHYAEI
ncbi:COP9 signalosome-like protein subunit 6 [Xylaria palmicola]|nr:COP9 signalosome-like protein subunit 6 [Xylaria palmicola]